MLSSLASVLTVTLVHSGDVSIAVLLSDDCAVHSAVKQL